MMTYEDSIAYIRQIQSRGSKPGLERMRVLLDALGNPERECKYVHVAGTNGKGSFCCMLANVLSDAEYTTGLFTSPHMVRINERMKIDGHEISDSELSELLERVIPIAESMEDLPTEFEVMTAIGFMFFARHRTQIVVLEAGMGGELDSTNVIDSPELAVITNIGLDHTAYLGKTFGEIAATKAKIIKPGCSALFYGQNPEAEAAIAARCTEVGVHLRVADYSEIRDPRASLDGSSFVWAGPRRYVSLIGRHQIYNAAMVLEAVSLLKARGWRISLENVSNGLRQTYWPGRFEVLQREHVPEKSGEKYIPNVIVDGGHNPQGVTAAVETLREVLPGRKYIYVMGVMADKDIPSIIGIMAADALKVFAVRPENNRNRAMDPGQLAEEIRQCGVDATVCDSVEEGLRQAIDLASSLADGTPVVCLGSLYMYRQVKQQFTR